MEAELIIAAFHKAFMVSCFDLYPFCAVTCIDKIWKSVVVKIVLFSHFFLVVSSLILQILVCSTFHKTIALF